MQNCFEIYDNYKKPNTEACLIAVHGLSVLGVVFALADFHDNPAWIMMLSCVLPVILIHAWNNKIWKTIVFALLLAVTIIYITVFREWFLSGIYQLANNGIALFNYHYGKEVLYYSLPEFPFEERALDIFVCYLIIIIGMMLRYVLEAKYIWLFVVCNFLTVMPSLFLDDKAAGITCIFSCMAVLGAVMWNNSGVQGGKRLTLYMYACLLIGLIISGIYYGAGSYSSNLTVAKMRQGAINGAQEMIFGEADSPQGNLGRAASFVGTDSEKLFVTVSKPGVYYLKGYVGGVYKDGVWNEIERSRYSDSYEGLFYWMGEKQFHPLAQNSEYIDIAKDLNGFDSERLELKVDNIAASKRYIYMPYGLTSESLNTFSGVNRDMNILSVDRDLKTYSVQFDNYDSDEAFAFESPEWLNAASSDEALNDFRDAQVEYMTFVYDNYLDLDSQWNKYFDSVLDKTAVNGYVTITNEIRKWLEDKTAVSDGVDTDDYLMYFLTKVREGNSSFYASAGTLMYRYYGIPARYVEGYLADVSENENDNGIIYNTNDNGDIVYSKALTGANVHAWVEIYKDGIGWIPVEVTPGFYTELEINNQVKLKQQEQEQSEQEQDKKKEQKKNQVHAVSILKYIGIALLIVCVMAIVTIIVRRRIICYMRKRILHGGDIHKAVRLWSKFMKQLLIFNNMSEEDMAGDIIEILQRYRFRDGIISSEDYQRMMDFAYDTQRSIYNDERYIRRLKMKYILSLI